MAQILIDSGHRTHLAVCQEDGCPWRSACTSDRARALQMARDHETEAHPGSGSSPTYQALRHAQRNTVLHDS